MSTSPVSVPSAARRGVPPGSQVMPVRSQPGVVVSRDRDRGGEAALERARAGKRVGVGPVVVEDERRDAELGETT